MSSQLVNLFLHIQYWQQLIRLFRLHTAYVFYFLTFLLSFLALSSFYPLTVGVEVTAVLDHTLRHTYTLDRTPLKEGSARRGNPYLTTHNAHKKQTSLPRRDSNPRPQNHALDCATTRIGISFLLSAIPNQTPQTREKKNNVMMTTVITAMAT